MPQGFEDESSGTLGLTEMQRAVQREVQQTLRSRHAMSAEQLEVALETFFVQQVIASRSRKVER